ncbi:MAG: prepilin signal peptidase PulO-like enzyme (type II secretory pathway) [Candidatus Paceibacteria bacterium]|jgi:prepilin signal peptidase PulO-like enzyme (type II secretory pathway)
MDIFLIVTATILGLLVGSFLNVVALRFNTGKSLGGRSECFSCGHVLNPKDLFPLFSFLFQGGRCRYCSSSISLDNIYAEVITAIFFGLIAARGVFLGTMLLSVGYLVATIFLFVVFSILMVIFLYDLKHKIIPDALSVAFGLFALVSSFFFEFVNKVFVYTGFHAPSLEHLLAGVLIPIPFVLLWIFSKGQWIGLGDPKLMVGIGFLLGMNLGISSIFISFWIGALFALSVYVVNRIFKKTLLRTGKKSIMKSELPFAPFLIIATLITLVFNLQVI